MMGPVSERSCIAVFEGGGGELLAKASESSLQKLEIAWKRILLRASRRNNPADTLVLAQ